MKDDITRSQDKDVITILDYGYQKIAMSATQYQQEKHNSNYRRHFKHYYLRKIGLIVYQLDRL